MEVPEEIVEAARIDGCSEFGIFRRIVVPAIVLYVLMQVFQKEGMTAGAMKG